MAVVRSLALGLQFSWVRWNGVMQPAGAGPFTGNPAYSGLSTDAWMHRGDGARACRRSARGAGGAVGIYGVMAYTVAQRSQEIGIRLALGADSSQVLRMVVGGGLRLALLVYQVSTTDPLTLAATAGVLVASALLASWIPARRATRVDPAVSLRAE